MRSLKVAALFSLTLGALNGCGTSTKTVYEPQADREGIRAAIQPRLKSLRECYELAIDAYPGAEGKVMAEWDLSREGTVTNLKFTEFDKTLEGGRACLTEKISTWTFPKPTSSEVVTVKYPLFFSERAQFQGK